MAGEVVDEGSRAWIFEHANDLGFEDAVVLKLVFAGELEELVVGHGRPEEVGEAGGEFVSRKRANGGDVLAVPDALAVQFDAEKEVGADEDGLEGELEAAFEGFAVLASQIDECEEAFDFLGTNRASVGSLHERGENGSGGFAPGVGGGGTGLASGEGGFVFRARGRVAEQLDRMDVKVAITLELGVG